MAQLNLRIDDELKKDVDFVCSELGLTISIYVNLAVNGAFLLK